MRWTLEQRLEQGDGLFLGNRMVAMKPLLWVGEEGADWKAVLAKAVKDDEFWIDHKIRIRKYRAEDGDKIGASYGL